VQAGVLKRALKPQLRWCLSLAGAMAVALHGHASINGPMPVPATGGPSVRLRRSMPPFASDLRQTEALRELLNDPSARTNTYLRACRIIYRLLGDCRERYS
jgi:hypothetical protein